MNLYDIKMKKPPEVSSFFLRVLKGNAKLCTVLMLMSLTGEVWFSVSDKWMLQRIRLPLKTSRRISSR